MSAQAFWDTSALVPLCVREELTPQAIDLYKAYEAVVWWATPVEMASAFARALKARKISSRDCNQARRLAHDLALSWLMVQPSEALRSKATELVERYDLRAADALQLAAAWQWSAGDPFGHVFICADQRLREAALKSGFDAKELRCRKAL